MDLNEYIRKYHSGWLELVHLPTYSPELNPTELLWAHLKSHGLNRVLTKTQEKFLTAVNKHLKRFANERDFVRRFFLKDELQYINQESKTAA